MSPKKIRVYGPISARRVVMMKAWREVKERENRGEFADYGEIIRKYWAEIKPKLQQKKPFDVEV